MTRLVYCFITLFLPLATNIYPPVQLYFQDFKSRRPDGLRRMRAVEPENKFSNPLLLSHTLKVVTNETGDEGDSDLPATEIGLYIIW